MTMPLNEINYLNDYSFITNDAFKPAWFRNEQLYNCDTFVPEKNHKNALLSKLKTYLNN